MVLVRKFFCLELLTTGLVIGWFGLIESISSCVSGIVMLENIDVYLNGTTIDDKQNLDPAVVRSILINLIGTNIALNIIDIVASGLLIAGTVKRNRLLLVPWLINSGLSLFLVAIAAVIFVVLVLATNQIPLVSSIFVIVACFITFSFYAYTWIAIYSLYELFRRGEPASEYSRLIGEGGSPGNPVYTRA